MTQCVVSSIITKKSKKKIKLNKIRLSCVMCHMSLVRCHVVHVICHLSPGTNTNNQLHRQVLSLLTPLLCTVGWFLKTRKEEEEKIKMQKIFQNFQKFYCLLVSRYKTFALQPDISSSPGSMVSRMKQYMTTNGHSNLYDWIGLRVHSVK